MSEIACFWVEPTGEAELELRRFVFSGHGTCPDPPNPWGYCNEVVHIGRGPERRDEKGYLSLVPAAEYEGDPRWPTACRFCERPFEGRSYEAQVNQEPLYRGPDGTEWRMDRLPPGAMFSATWATDWGTGPEGIALMVVTPYQGEDARSGFWHVDGPASGQGNALVPNAWTRSGDPRVPGSVSATPSIQTADYHGFLTNGRLVSV